MPVLRGRRVQVGERFGRLLVVEYLGTLTRPSRDGKRVTKHALFRCQCDCGRKHDAKGTSLRIGHTQSCGCARADSLRARLPTLHLKHGETSGGRESQVYGAWQRAKRKGSTLTLEAFRATWAGLPPRGTPRRQQRARRQLVVKRIQRFRKEQAAASSLRDGDYRKYAPQNEENCDE